MSDGLEKDFFQVSEAKLLLENFCLIFEDGGRREAMLEVCEDGDGKAGGADLLT